jgi:hypothetical protein
MAPSRSIVLSALAALLVVLATSPQDPRQLPGTVADPLPPGLILPPPAQPMEPPVIPLTILRPPPAIVTAAQRAIGALIAVPAAPKPTLVDRAPVLSITLPPPSAVSHRATRPDDRLWGSESTSPSTPPPGTPRTGWVDATR